ncbi:MULTISPECIES: FAD-binding oxidoreductase [unclassified Variovorax]|uniref:FAD-binding oxidoreductase n=1 Tax=unclassified Variovorax TaxID=663243 RepID=UPI000D12A312|nr:MULTISPECIES: FAD-binding oxidoreductase [unclassified Variovorax]AVQ85621.1 FAD-linked oxidase [Variovorax sp. PMC12]QRY35249.1 FAD-binding oxidoreductase [Variovorax sp. PDNC026]
MSPDAETAAHEARKNRLLATMQHGREVPPAPVALAKHTSNLFRDRETGPRQRINLGEFDHVIGIDTSRNTVEVEGLATYEHLVAATLRHGMMPAVVPQLKTITAGGAVAGVGIEATSMRQGLVHHTMLELDVLLPHGVIVHCTPDNAHRDLFFGFPNSYGTLGYALRLVLRTLPVQPCVRVEHIACQHAGEFFQAISEACESDADFVDGVVFGPRSMVLNIARFEADAPWQSNYEFERIYYRSLLEMPVDHLSVHDYLWRWDTDWFWCSRNFGAQIPLIRRLLGRKHLNSRTYTRLMRMNARWGMTRRLAAFRGAHGESVIQDVDIPIRSAPAFLDFLQREIGILPVWICPVHVPDPSACFALYPLEAGTLHVNFGFWDVIERHEAHEPGHFNRLVEQEVLRMGGIKSLYSDSFFTREEFGRAYGMDTYTMLKRRYDPEGRAPDLYDKCVLKR